MDIKVEEKVYVASFPGSPEREMYTRGGEGVILINAYLAGGENRYLDRD